MGSPGPGSDLCELASCKLTHVWINLVGGATGHPRVFFHFQCELNVFVHSIQVIVMRRDRCAHVIDLMFQKTWGWRKGGQGLALDLSITKLTDTGKSIAVPKVCVMEREIGGIKVHSEEPDDVVYLQTCPLLKHFIVFQAFASYTDAVGILVKSETMSKETTTSSSEGV